MSRLSRVLRDVEDGGLMFWCPGCDGAHMIKYGTGPGPRWGWNGDAERPTFTPSIMVRSTKLTEKGKAALDAWRKAGYPKQDDAFESVPTICHSFVTAGQIQFLGDCTHELAGKTVPLPDFPWSEL